MVFLRTPGQIIDTTFTVLGYGLVCIYLNADSVGFLDNLPGTHSLHT
jgi:hypothetical protein